MEKNIKLIKNKRNIINSLLLVFSISFGVNAQDSTAAVMDSSESSVVSIDLSEIPDSLLRSTIDSVSKLLSVEDRAFISSYLLDNHPIYTTGWGRTGNLLPQSTTFNEKDTFNFTLIEGQESFYINEFDSFNWGYGPRWGRMHRGWDLQMDIGDTLRAAFNGVVRYAQYNDGGYGNCVVIRHLNGIETLYAHLSKLDCEPGDFVRAGELIGLAGSTGRSSGPHLHWEWRYMGQSFDAMIAIDTSNYLLKADSLQLTGSNLQDPPEYKIRKTATYHTVKSGETLSHIAQKYHTSVSSLVRKNKLRNPDQLQIGQRIRIR
jgi:murein DD-endopeptidase MepM/ murein hydrolase activator NlpD